MIALCGRKCGKVGAQTYVKAGAQTYVKAGAETYVKAAKRKEARKVQDGCRKLS